MASADSMERLEQYVRRKTWGHDPAHDFEHTRRVCSNAKRLARREGADQRLAAAAALLHDIISYPKSDPRSKNSAKESAEEARSILPRYGFAEDEIRTITEAICDHSFSGGASPRSMTGRILQDADRLDAIGAIGIARAFSVGGSGGRSLYNSGDPFCKKREPDDKRWTLDHFYKKLILLEKKMNTQSGRLEARARARMMALFLKQLRSEI